MWWTGALLECMFLTCSSRQSRLKAVYPNWSGRVVRNVLNLNASQCVAKDRKCSYLPSKRGGPRKKKQKTSPSPDGELPSDDVQYAAAASTEIEERMNHLVISNSEPSLIVL